MNARPPRFLTWLFRVLLRFHPRPFRETWERELEEYVKESWREEAAGRGMAAAAAFWKKAFLGVIATVVRQRLGSPRVVASGRTQRQTLLNISWLDVKLGVRMVAKYPGLSLVSVLGMAVAIAIGAGVFGVISAIVDPTLPLSGGDRIVAVVSRRADIAADAEMRVLHDFVVWRSQLTTVRDLSAFRLNRRNLIIEGRGTQLVDIAEMSAAGFRVAQIPPLLGRPLLDDDERAGATHVLVIGYEEWQRRFDGDPNIIGTNVRVGETVHTIVGVMAEGFRFPYNQGYWVPLQLNVSNYARGAGPEIYVAGRLADGVTIEEARAQIAVIGRRMAAAFPDTNEHLRPTIVPYTHLLFERDAPGKAWVFYLVQLATTLVLVLVAANVAVLVYARTAMRAGEIAVRTALGASRTRVIAQLFVEALVLAVAAAVFGVTVAVFALGRVEPLLKQEIPVLPFWFDLSLSGGLIAYVAGLAILGAAIVGVLPALKATGRNAYSDLQKLAARGSQMQLGRIWTALIVVQVSVAVTVLPPTIGFSRKLVQYGMGESGYPAEEFFRASIRLERWERPANAEEGRAMLARRDNRAEALMRRLASEPGIEAAFATDLFEPGASHSVEIGEAVSRLGPPASTSPQPPVAAATSFVSAGYFELFDAPILAGRSFSDADAAEGSTAVIVDRSFAERMSGGNVVGRLIRVPRRDGSRPEDAEEAPWLEIVGVVKDLPFGLALDDAALPNIYSAVRMGAGIIVRARAGASPTFTRRLRDIAVSVDPGLQLSELENLAEVERSNRRTFRSVAVGTAAAMLSVLLLSVAGIYAMLSFTVARQRREIGIRIALGADRRRILAGIFARASAQLGAGVTAGLILALALQWTTSGRTMGLGSGDVAQGASFVMPIVAAIVLAVGLLGALGPARRALAVQPTEALRHE